MDQSDRRIQINFVPHHHSFTRCSHHFSRISDGFAEFIDNSVQECREHDSKVIRISIHLNRKAASGFAAILDNGVGMTNQRLEYFATHSLNQDSRARLEAREASSSQQVTSLPDSKDPSYLSKYGVGAKQAGFFLGDRLHVITRPRNCPRAGELVLDEKEMDEKAIRGENVYQERILDRMADGTRFGADERLFDERASVSLRRECLDHELKNDSFTIVIIRLRPEIVRRMLTRESLARIQEEIAEIYHFRLHPDHAPHLLVNDERWQSIKEDIRPKTFPSGQRTVAPPVISINFSVFENDSPKLTNELAGVRNLLSLYHSEASAMFCFTMKIEDPIPDNSTDGLSLTQINMASQLRMDNDIIGNMMKSCEAFGVLFYYPFNGEVETRPTQSSVEGINVDADENPTAEPTPEIEDIFRVVWNWRLVPETTVKTLSFLPKAFSKPQCDAAGLPVYWRCRLKGFLFFDRDFPHISNNKLKFTVNPSFSEWLNQKPVSNKILYSPKPADLSFKKWLCCCHDDLDFDLRLMERLPELERKHSKPESPRSFFRVLMAGKTKLEVGEMIRLNGPLSSLPNSRKGELFGTIQRFFVSQQLESQYTTYVGPAFIQFVREPTALFGDQPEALPLSVAINMKADLKVKPTELKDLQKSVIRDVRIQLFSSAREDGVPMTENMVVTAGKEFAMIAVQPLSLNGDIATSRPQSGPGHRYAVHMVLRSSNNGEHDFAKTSELWEHDRDKGEFIRCSDKKKKKECFYSYFRGAFKATGTSQLEVAVWDGDRVAFNKTISFKVESLRVAQFEIVDEFAAQILPLGSFFPPFTLKLLDSYGNPVQYTGNVELVITAKNMLITASDMETTIFPCEQESELQFDGDLWKAVPSEDHSIIPENKLSAKVTFSLSLFHSTVNEDNSDRRGKQIGTAKKFTVEFRSGPPVLIEPSGVPETVVNGSVVPPVTLICRDAWGHKVYPKPEEPSWKFILDPRGPLRCQQDINVLSSGVALLKNAVIEESDIPFDGLEVSQLIMLDTSNGEDFAAGGFALLKSKGALSVQLEFRVTPSSSPHELIILRDGIPVGERVTLTAGVILTGLSFRILDEGGIELTLEPSWFEGKQTGLRVSWLSDERQNKLLSIRSNTLPDLEVPREADINSFEVSLHLFGGLVLTTCLIVEVIPSYPTKWKIFKSPAWEEWIRAGESEDFRQKFGHLCLLDEFDNLIRSIPENLPPPILTVVAVDDNDNTSRESFEIELRRFCVARSNLGVDINLEPTKKKGSRRKSAVQRSAGVVITEDEVQCFVPSPSSRIEASQVPSNLLFSIADSDEVSGLSFKGVLTNGPPRRLLLSSASLGCLKPVSSLDASIGCFQAIPDLVVELVDSCGNAASLSKTSKFVLRIVDSDNGQVLFHCSDIKSSRFEAPLSIETSESSQKVLKLDCLCSYQGPHSTEVVESAALILSVRPINAVSKIRVEWHEPSHQRMVTNLQISPSVEFPVLRLFVETEDGFHFLPPSDAFVVKVSRRSFDGTSCHFREDEFFERKQVNPQLECTECLPGFGFRDASYSGQYKFEIVYIEQRESMAFLPKQKRKVIVEFEVTVLPFVADSMTLEESSRKKLETLVVSNSQLSPTGRLIAKGIRLIAKNASTECSGRWPDGSSVICSLAIDRNCATVVDLPELEDSVSINGVNGVLAELAPNNSSGLFRRLQLKPSIGSGQGTVLLQFCLMTPNGTPTTRSVETVVIRFVTDESIASHVEELKQKLAPVIEQLDSFQKQKESFERYLNETTRDIKSMVSKSSSGKLRCFDDVKDMTQKTVSNLQLQLKEQRSDMTRARSQVRMPVKKPNYPTDMQTAGLEFVGLVVDLGFVADDHDAFILSAAAAPRMDCLVTKNEKTSQELYQRGLKSWALDSMLTFYVVESGNKKRGRNEKELASRQLPLSSLALLQGNPKYMVNLVQLPPDDEHLRDSLFFSIFKDTVLIDDLETAMQFRHPYLRRHQRPPTIYTRRGEVLPSDGMLDPTSTRGVVRLDRKLEYMFGQLPQEVTHTFQEIERDIELSREIAEMLVKRDEIVHELENLSSEEPRIKQLRAQRTELLEELEELGVSASQGGVVVAGHDGNRSRKRQLSDVGHIDDDRLLEPPQTSPPKKNGRKRKP